MLIELFPAGDVEGLRDYLPGRAIVPDPLSDRALAKIKKWMATCMDHHHECDESDSSILPTRVIDVRPVRPRLHLLNGASRQYIALSHCWGGVTSFRTTTATIDQHVEGFDIAALPQNFQDAVKVTRKLEIPYLWIDSLCIIQDDADDWEQEAGRMIDVYRNSVLTISAMSAQNSHEGFLHRRNSPGRFSCEVPFSSSERQISGTAIVSWPPSSPGPDVLATRGWTLQELILPSRVLHFSAEQMIWDVERRNEKTIYRPSSRVISALESGAGCSLMMPSSLQPTSDGTLSWRTIPHVPSQFPATNCPPSQASRESSK